MVCRNLTTNVLCGFSTEFEYEKHPIPCLYAQTISLFLCLVNQFLREKPGRSLILSLGFLGAPLCFEFNPHSVVLQPTKLFLSLDIILSLDSVLI